MRKNVLYVLIIAGIILIIGNLWSADFDTTKINFWSIGASFLMVILGILELKKKQKK